MQEAKERGSFILFTVMAAGNQPLAVGREVERRYFVAVTAQGVNEGAGVGMPDHGAVVERTSGDAQIVGCPRQRGDRFGMGLPFGTTLPAGNFPDTDLPADMAAIRAWYRPWQGKNRGTV